MRFLVEKAEGPSPVIANLQLDGHDVDLYFNDIRVAWLDEAGYMERVVISAEDKKKLIACGVAFEDGYIKVMR